MDSDLSASTDTDFPTGSLMDTLSSHEKTDSEDGSRSSQVTDANSLLSFDHESISLQFQTPPRRNAQNQGNQELSVKMSRLYSEEERWAS